MKKRSEPPRPEDKTFGVTFRYVNNKYADASAYKDHVVVTLPGDREWFTPNDAERLARAILAAVDHQRKIDAWNLRYRPGTSSGNLAAKRARAKKKRNA